MNDEVRLFSLINQILDFIWILLKCKVYLSYSKNNFTYYKVYLSILIVYDEHKKNNGLRTATL